MGALIGFRLVIVAVLLFVAGYLEAFQEVTLRRPVFGLISATFALTVLYTAMLGAASYTLQAATQVVGDIFVITGFVYLTGVDQAGFVALYPVVILCGTVALGRGFVFAGLATLLYGVTLLLIRSHLIAPEGLGEIALGPLRPLINSILILALVGGTVAALGRYLARSLAYAGEQLDRASGKLSALEDLNRVIVESMQSGIALTDGSRRVVFANRVSSELLGVDVGDGASSRSGTASLLEGLDETGDLPMGEMAREVQVQCPDGVTRTVGVTISPLSSRSLAGGFLLTFRDMTELRRLEDHARMNERLAAVGGAAAHLAHEIRNPLGAITAAARLLGEEATPPDDRATLLSIIRTESDRLNRILTETLAGLREGSPEPAFIAMETALRDFVQVLSLSPDKHSHHEILTDIQPGPHPVAIGSEEIKQILWNLAKNGLEAMPEGGSLVLSLWSETDSTFLDISDQGPGLDPRRLSRLFEPLQTTKTLGTGLGLAIAHRMVRRRGGDLSIRSQPGHGTTVRVVLPRGTAPASFQR